MSRYLSDEEYNSLIRDNYSLKSKLEAFKKGTYVDKEVSKFKRVNARLEKMVASRDKKLEKIDGENYRLKLQIRKLEEENKALKAENEKLKIIMAKDHTNSSFPSSALRFPVRVSNSRIKTDRKPGGQPGHKGHPRRQYEADEIVYLERDENIISSEEYVFTGEYLSRKLIDLDVKVKVIEYKAKIFQNIITSKTIHSGFPEGVDNEINYSSNIKAMAYYLNNYCNVSIDKTRDFIDQISNHRISLSKGFISNLNRQFHERSKKDVEELFSSLSKADVLYTDNTNARVNGKGRFVYVSTDKDKVIYNSAEHKGHEGVKLTPVSLSLGTIVHDHDKTFYNYGKDHQECLAHILRYLQSSIDYEHNLTWSSLMKAFLQETIHEVKNGSLDEKQIKKKKKRYEAIIHTGLKEYVEHPPNDYYMDGFNLLMRLREYEDSTLYFLDHPQVDYTNNISESLCRKVKRKIRSVTTFRSDDSLSHYCDGLSIIETARCKDQNVFTKICDIFDQPKIKEKPDETAQTDKIKDQRV